MSYKYKDEIIMNLKDYNAGRRVVTGDTNDFESKLEELYEVYSQVSEYEEHKVATTVLVNTLKSKADEYEAKAKAFDELQSQLKEGKPYDDGYMGWASAQSYDSALRKVLELTKKLKDKYEDKLDDMR